MWQGLSVRNKLLFAMITVNMVLTSVMYWQNNRSFERGFSNYLAQQLLAEQDELAAGLISRYQRFGSWQWLQEKPEVLQELGLTYSQDRLKRLRLPPLPSEHRHSQERPPPPPRHERYFFGLIVLDAKGIPLMGFKQLPPDAVSRPLHLNDKLIGYLSYLPRHDLSNSLDTAFRQQQQQTFALIALAMLGGSILLAWGIAQWLNHRLRPLTQGTQHLIKGQFQHRLAITGQDELSQLAADFNRLAQSLEAHQQDRQRWIVDISHELRTPLTILQGELEALCDGIRPASPDYLQSLWQEIQRLTRLVSDLHLLSQADAGSLSYHWQPIDVYEHLEDCLDQMSHAFANKALTLTLTGTSAIIMADDNRLKQLWQNLAQNTLRYTDAGGQLHITLKVVGEKLIVIWEDSSPCVSDADLPRLTERLFRVDHSRQQQTGGSGLGLSIVKAIADAHHASLEASHSHLGGLCWTLAFKRI